MRLNRFWQIAEINLLRCFDVLLKFDLSALINSLAPYGIITSQFGHWTISMSSDNRLRSMGSDWWITMISSDEGWWCFLYFVFTKSTKFSETQCFQWFSTFCFRFENPLGNEKISHVSGGFLDKWFFKIPKVDLYAGQNIFGTRCVQGDHSFVNCRNTVRWSRRSHLQFYPVIKGVNLFMTQN